MTDADGISSLEHRGRELQTAAVAIVGQFGIERASAGLGRAELDEIKVAGKGEAPARRLTELDGAPRHA